MGVVFTSTMSFFELNLFDADKVREAVPCTTPLRIDIEARNLEQSANTVVQGGPGGP